MHRSEVAEALAYLYWARDRIVSAAGALSDEEFRKGEPAATRSLRSTLAHQVENEWAWRVRLSQGAFPAGDIAPGDYPTLSALMERWRHEERELLAWVDGLSEGDLAATPPGTDNLPATWRCLLYVVNHGTQQFTEAALVLTWLGRSPGDIGYLAFCSGRSDAPPPPERP